MKINQSDYERIRAGIHRAMATLPLDFYRTMYPELSAERIRWDYFWMACQHDTTLSADLYRYLSDAHIDTALRLIVPIE